LHETFLVKCQNIGYKTSSATLKQMLKMSAIGTNTDHQPNSPLINHFINNRLLDA